MSNTTRLREFMLSNGLTVSELAREVGVDKSAISRIHRGLQTPSKRMIDGIMESCRRRDPTVTYEELFGVGA